MPSSSRAPLMPRTCRAHAMLPAWRSVIAALRMHQWVKSALLLVPLATAHALFDPRRLSSCLLAAAAFCLAASSVYVFNDLTDVVEDRRNAQTAQRPLARGAMTRRQALALQLLLLLGALVLAWPRPHAFLWVLAGYYALMCTYSLILKRLIALDVLVLAAGYGLRVAAGAAAAGVQPSAWLLALCGALFLSLALLKRYAELLARQVQGTADALRGYLPGDASILACQGIASGYIAVLVLALYSTMAHRPPTRQPYLWVLCVLLLYWINYLWLLARRGRLPHDPVLFTLRDPISGSLIGAMGIAALLAL